MVFVFYVAYVKEEKLQLHIGENSRKYMLKGSIISSLNL
jgi:hypothetical protein